MNQKAEKLALEIAPDDKGYGPAIRLRLAETLSTLTDEIEQQYSKIKELEKQVRELLTALHTRNQELNKLQLVEASLTAARATIEEVGKDIKLAEEKAERYNLILDKAAKTIEDYRNKGELDPNVTLRNLLSLVRTKESIK